MARTKKQTESVNTGHMPRRGTCKRSADGAHRPRVDYRMIYQVTDEHGMRYYPSLPHGFHVTEVVSCADCGKRGQSGRQRVTTLDQHVAAGPTPMFRSPITPEDPRG